MEKDLLEKYIVGNVTEEEVEIVAAWMKEDENHLEEVRALRKLYAISLFNNPDMQQLERESTDKHHGFNYKKALYEFLKVTAVFLIAYIGFKWVYMEKESKLSYQTLFVPTGQRAELTLPDSTKVWLNSLSKITYPTDFSRKSRSVELEGEAYFDVSHDSERPFIVKTQHLNIKVLGTEFNVIDYSDSNITEVTLLKGSVELLPAGASQIYKMKENERVCIQNNRFIFGENHSETNMKEEKNVKTGKAGDCTMYISKINNYDYFEWKNGLICFDDEPVEKILDKLATFYDMKIICRNTSFFKKKYTGKFRSKDGIEHILKVLQLEEKFRFERDEEKDIIIIK